RERERQERGDEGLARRLGARHVQGGEGAHLEGRVDGERRGEPRVRRPLPRQRPGQRARLRVDGERDEDELLPGRSERSVREEPEKEEAREHGGGAEEQRELSPSAPPDEPGERERGPQGRVVPREGGEPEQRSGERRAARSSLDGGEERPQDRDGG